MAAIVAAMALVLCNTARADWLGDWLGWNRPTPITAGYYYVPTTSYRTLYSPVAVTSYMPATTPACGACGAGAAASYMPVTTYVQKPILQAYTSYHLVYAPIVAPPPACGCATANYPPAPACGSCGCASCGCATGGCAATGGFAPTGCSSCGAAVAAAPALPVAASAAPSISYMASPATGYVASSIAAPITSTPYLPSAATAGPIDSGPVYASGPVPVVSTYPPSYSPQPCPVSGAPSAANTLSPTYAMPLTPGAPPAGIPPAGSSPTYGGVIPQGTPTLAPPAGGSSADVAPRLPGPVPPSGSISPNAAPASPNTIQPRIPASPDDTQPGTQKTFEKPATPASPPQKMIPDIRIPAAPSSSGSQRPLDPNSRTAYSMPMMRPGINYSSPWPIAKTTAALMPIVPASAEAPAAPKPLTAADADGWHAMR